MIYKIKLKKEERERIEYLRGVSGNYNSEVFFWDIVTREEFSDKESCETYVNQFVCALDLEDIKIIEVLNG